MKKEVISDPPPWARIRRNALVTRLMRVCVRIVRYGMSVRTPSKDENCGALGESEQVLQITLKSLSAISHYASRAFDRHSPICA